MLCRMSVIETFTWNEAVVVTDLILILGWPSPGRPQFRAHVR